MVFSVECSFSHHWFTHLSFFFFLLILGGISMVINIWVRTQSPEIDANIDAQLIFGSGTKIIQGRKR